jgi:hypothetical protein
VPRSFHSLVEASNLNNLARLRSIIGMINDAIRSRGGTRRLYAQLEECIFVFFHGLDLDNFSQFDHGLEMNIGFLFL